MITHTPAFDEAMKAPTKQIRAVISYTDGDGQTHTTTSEDDLKSFKKVEEGYYMNVGVDRIEISTVGDVIPLDTFITIAIGVNIGTLEAPVWEDMPIGKYTVEEVEMNEETGVAKYKGTGQMGKFTETEYSAGMLTYPTTVSGLLTQVAERMTATLGTDPATLPNATAPIDVDLWESITGTTFRNIVGEIAGATATMAKFNALDGKLYLRQTPKTADGAMTEQNLKKYKIKPEVGQYNSVVLSRMPQNDNIVISNQASITENGLHELKIINNEILNKQRETTATPILESILGFNYSPFEATTEGHGWHEVGDLITVQLNGGAERQVLITSVSLSIDGGIKEIIKGEPLEDTGTTDYSKAGGIARTLYRTELEVDKQGHRIEAFVGEFEEFKEETTGNFTRTEQTITEIVGTVQKSGGGNQIRNSVGFAYDSTGLTGWQNYFATRKNVFNKASLTPGFIAQDTGAIVEGEGANLSWPASQFAKQVIDVEAGKPITFSSAGGAYAKTSRLRIYDNAGNFATTVSVPSLVTASYTWTPREQYGYAIWLFHEGITEAQADTIQAEHASSATAYEAFTAGQIASQSSAESKLQGGLSGQIILLDGTRIEQGVHVTQWDDGQPADAQTEYTLTFRVRKLAGAGSASYIRIFTQVGEHRIELGDNDAPFYTEYTVGNLRPHASIATVEIYAGPGSQLAISDLMLNVGGFKTPWQQAQGEIMNTQVSVTNEGLRVKSNNYDDEMVITPQEFAGYSNGERIFSLNRDTTVVKKIEVAGQIDMPPMKIVSIQNSSNQGWAFVGRS